MPDYIINHFESFFLIQNGISCVTRLNIELFFVSFFQKISMFFLLIVLI
nr:MAG TPA: hypothetical protein [Caudoviricetes sp.]DAX54584.1 MAG TPA: hypothetical protein [Caudoviricetes sp.]